MEIEPLVSRIRRFSRDYPGKIAVKSDYRKVTYAQLEQGSNRLAAFLTAANRGESCHAAVVLDRSCALVETLTGLLKCGTVFVPLCPQFPAARIKNMIASVHARWLITNREHYAKLKDVLQDLSLQVLLLDSENENENGNEDDYENGAGGDEIPQHHFNGENNPYCYIYFTSGSTGEPRAILGLRRSLSHFIDWEIRRFAIDDSYNVSQLTLPSFDPSLRDIFVPLASGGTCCIPGDHILADMPALLRWLEDNEIHLVHTVPSLFKRLTAAAAAAADPPRRLKNLKYIMLAGELLRGGDIAPFTGIFENRIQLVNFYGCTETTMIKLFYPIQPADGQRSIIPAGQPMDGARVMVLDSKLRKCSPGKKGEIYIRTPFRSAGYYNNPQANEKVFIKNPFGKHEDDIIYKTGDTGRELPDGNIEVSGRLDDQVKIMGARVELGEIENRLLMHELVKDAVVMAQSYPGEEDGNYLTAYVIPVPGQPAERHGKPVTQVLREYLAQHLPLYMVPVFFEFLPAFPLTPGGKIDRAALPLPRVNVPGAPGAAPAGVHYTAPRDELEQQLVQVWQEVLSGYAAQPRKIGIDDHFFKAGGHSLLATLLVSRVKKELQVDLTLSRLFENPSVRELAECIRREEKMRYSSVYPVEKKDYYVLSAGQRRIYFLQQIEPLSTAYNMPTVVQIRGDFARGQLDAVCRALIRRHESLRTFFVIAADEPVQRITEAGESRFVIEHDAVVPAAPVSRQREQAGMEDGEVERFIAGFIRPFELARSPLLRVGRLELGEDRYILMFDMHHIISDGLSGEILVNEFIALFEGEELAPLTICYKDYSEWQIKRFAAGDFKKQEDYWLERLGGEIPRLQLPLNYSRPKTRNFEGGRVRFTINEDMTKRLEFLMNESAATLNMILLAVCYILFYKYSRQQDFIIGQVTSGRAVIELTGIIGVFVNMMALRNKPEGQKQFIEFLAEVKENTVAALEHQDYPFDELVNKLGLTREANRYPLIDVVFQLRGFAADSRREFSSLEVLPYELKHNLAKFDLFFDAVKLPQSIALTIQYARQLFQQSTVDKIGRDYVYILEQVLENNKLYLQDIEIMRAVQAAAPALTEEEAGDFGF